MNHRLRLSWDRVVDPKAKFVFLDKRVRGAQANVDVRKLIKAEDGGNASDDHEQATNEVSFGQLLKSHAYSQALHDCWMKLASCHTNLKVHVITGIQATTLAHCTKGTGLL